jgi:hypothetical protein
MRRCINMQRGLCALLVFEPCAWPIQKPVAQHYPFRPADRRLFERNHGVKGTLARARCSEIERIGFGVRTHAWRVDESDALHNQTPYAGSLGCGHQIARSVNAQTRIAFEAFLILWRARRERQISELVYHHLRRGSPDNTRELIRIEHIDHNRLGAEGTQNAGLVSRASGADDDMSGRTQQRREPTPDYSTRPGQKYFHCVLVGDNELAPRRSRELPCDAGGR